MISNSRWEGLLLKNYWWKEAVCYEIYPRSFMDSNGDGIGDLKGIISKLDYLQHLGIEVLWICPFFKSPNADNGYDISDYQDIMDEFGSMVDFELLLEESHKRGLKVILDLVINHTSDEHPWFIESRSSKDNPKRDWYIWKDGERGKEPNNWESIFSGSAWELDKKTKQYYLHLFYSKQPDLNWENKEMRYALYEMIKWWLDKGIDGFRVDAISHIKKSSGMPDMPNPKKLDYVSSFDLHMNQEGIHEFLKELKEETFDKYDIMTVGEANGVNTKQAEEWVGEQNGKFDMVFQFEHLGLWQKGANKTVDVLGLKKTLTKWQTELHEKGWNALFFENHDQPRSVSTWGNDEEYWLESAKMLGACYFLMQGTPFIYQGQEIGMTNVQFDSISDYDDIGMKKYYQIELSKGRPHHEIMDIIWRNGRDNSRTPMQWNDTQNAGFTTGIPWMKNNENYKHINVEAQIKDPKSVYSFYKNMISLRKQHAVFIYGKYELLLDNHPAVYAYKRIYLDASAIVICNFGNEAQSVIFDEVPAGNGELCLSNYESTDKLFSKEVFLKPYEARVYLF